MTDILIQFHALTDELAAFLREAAAETSAHITAFRFQPFEAVAVEPDRIDSTLRDETIRELAFTLAIPTLPVATANQFLDWNSSALRLDIGRLSASGLNESCLSARTTDERTLAAWRKVAHTLRKATRAGAVATNPLTGATARLRSHRYTAGAKALYDEGVTIRPVAGSAVIHFGPL